MPQTEHFAEMGCELELYSTSNSGFFAIMQSLRRAPTSRQPVRCHAVPWSVCLRQVTASACWPFCPSTMSNSTSVMFFERFVPVRFNRSVVDEYIRPVTPSNESKTFGAVKPLNYSLVLSHTFLPSFSPGRRVNPLTRSE
jgi:hypothetical protein